MDCIFCKIAKGEIPSKIAYEDEKVFAFYDIEPKAPTHILIIPKVHIQSALQIDETNADIIAHIFKISAQIATSEGIAEDGYRVVTNVGENGGQSVAHLHFHILGGRSMQWPPG